MFLCVPCQLAPKPTRTEIIQQSLPLAVYSGIVITEETEHSLYALVQKFNSHCILFVR